MLVAITQRLLILVGAAAYEHEKRFSRISLHSSKFIMTNQINSYEALLKRVWADEDFKNGFIAAFV